MQAEGEKYGLPGTSLEFEFVSTVDKALELLNFFSERDPEIGLSEIARRSGYDKATTRRLLVSMERQGVVEQDPDSRKYRLGATLIRLARVREATHPLESVVNGVLERVVEETGETAHFSLIAGGALATVGMKESPRANRVSLERGERLPLHATASGLAFLAFGPRGQVKRALGRELRAHTDRTVTDADALSEMIEAVRHSGIAVSNQGYESDVFGMAAPVFDGSGFAKGAVAVATPKSRISPDVEATNRDALRDAAIDLTRALGASPHPILLGMAA